MVYIGNIIGIIIGNIGSVAPSHGFSPAEDCIDDRNITQKRDAAVAKAEEIKADVAWPWLLSLRHEKTR